ncbi:MAG: ATP-dependent helicase HepA [Firmicutes bacterium ADurb.Bin419]|nr:MAG: ATP-dependent helicase HepA [Firmicutes bacterium ADurb.Bin419]
MPTIYDNITKKLSEGLYNQIECASRVDYCAGYFNLRGWDVIADKIDNLSGATVREGSVNINRYCRLLVGMVKQPKELIIDSFLTEEELMIDSAQALNMKKKLAKDFKEQLTIGTPTEKDEHTLRKLAKQLKTGKVTVKLYLRHQLHAKLYLAYSSSQITPVLGLMGSSNMTLAGLSGQGELNIDVLEQDAAVKLSDWFNDRWNDRWCIDITKELIEIIETSWATEDLIPPYYIYLKMAYHLSREARAGLNEFKIPHIFKDRLLEFQQKAVLIAAHHLNKRGGVFVGDVVGIGKTIIATAIAKVLEEDRYFETLILCPKNLVKMWEDYVYKYQLHAKIISHSTVQRDLPNIRRYRTIIIDESHNFRSDEGTRYRAIKSYIAENESKVILLSATPYNKSFIDLSNQLRLFIPDDLDLGISPEQYINYLGGPVQFQYKHTETHIRSIKAFERSEYAEDWRELMRLYMVRRTRSFIKQNYAEKDPITDRKYLLFPDGRKSWFPDRVPKKIEFKLDQKDKNDQYARLYSETVEKIINSLELPRYGLGNYVLDKPSIRPNQEEEETIKNLSRAGKRLMGFCRTNLFKRLESSGYSFLLSLARHLLRNFIFIYALERMLPLPIGKQNIDFDGYLEDTDEDDGILDLNKKDFSIEENDYLEAAKKCYNVFEKELHDRFRWIRSELFVTADLKKALIDDTKRIFEIIEKASLWDCDADRKLNALMGLIKNKHSKDKLLIFTQFADTAEYIFEQLQARGIGKLAVAAGENENITELVKRFSPASNEAISIKNTPDELNILITTDVLSEGQNLQDAHIVVNFDLPWAIIRLIQRAGRVDRIGQESPEILCYSFLPEDGIEKIIKLRARLKTRIKENAEVVGSDEVFFDGDPVNIEDLYSEKAGILDDDDDKEVDIASYAYQIWLNATRQDETLKAKIQNLPDVIYSTKAVQNELQKSSVIVFAKTGEENDALMMLDDNGKLISQSYFKILKTAECEPATPAMEKIPNHHAIVKSGIDQITQEEIKLAGTLGRKNSTKYRTYMRLERYINEYKDTLLVTEGLKKAMDEIYHLPLKESAIETISRQMKAGISDQGLADLIVALRDDGRLCITQDEEVPPRLPKIICSLGIKEP